jgi:hypothetical protein
MDPRFESIRIPELGESPPGEHESVLQRVLGETRIAQDAMAERSSLRFATFRFAPRYSARELDR